MQKKKRTTVNDHLFLMCQKKNERAKQKQHYLDESKGINNNNQLL